MRRVEGYEWGSEDLKEKYTLSVTIKYIDNFF